MRSDGDYVGSANSAAAAGSSRQQQAAALRTGAYRAKTALARDLRRDAIQMSFMRRHSYCFRSRWIRFPALRCEDTPPRGRSTVVTGVSITQNIADIARAAAQHHSSNTCIALRPEQQQNRDRSSRNRTSSMPEASPGISVEAGQPGGARGGNV